MTNDANGNKTLGVRPGFSQAKRGFVPKGHDAVLKHLQDTGALIDLYLISTDDAVRGKIVARDRFTITLVSETGSRRVYFKHAIESFGEV